MEDGVDTKNLCVEMVKLKELNKELKDKVDKMTK